MLKQELLKYSSKIESYLAKSNGVGIVQLDANLNILDCNIGFMRLFNPRKSPTGEQLNAYIVLDVKDIRCDEELKIPCSSKTGMNAVNNCYLIQTDDGYLLFCERLLLTESFALEQIGKMNDELINLQRELIKKNHLLEKLTLELQDANVQITTNVNELEQRVADRTKELAASIDSLQSEIRERELAEKNLLKETDMRVLATEALSEKELMLIQQSRQAAMGEMIGNIAHQWRQPLNTLGLHTQSLGVFYGMPNFNKEFLDNSIAKSMEIIQHMSKTIDDFRDYFKPEKGKADFYVIEAIKNTLSLMEGSFSNPYIAIDLVDHDNPVINGYQNEFAQVFLNILNNARDAIIEREIADARITITICSENSCAVVTVADNAGGIPDEIINKVFDPYFTTKGPQSGTGIGLFMSKTIIEKNMGGRLTVRNTDTGAEFRIEV